MFKLEIKPVWVSKNKAKKTEDVPPANPIIDIDAVEQAVNRIGKKVALVAIAVPLATVAAGTLAAIAVKAFEHHLTK